MFSTTMETSAPQRTLLQVADLIIDLAGARVMRGAEEVALPRLSWELFRVLVEQAPGIVTTDTLLERVWPGLVVNPETVAQRVKLLRTALGDDPRQPRYITVVRGRGYRLASAAEPFVPTQPAATVVTDHHGAATPSTSRPPLTTRRAVLATMAAATALLTALLVWHFRHAPAHPTSATTIAAPQTIAVMPFRSLSADPVNDTIALGIAEAVRHQLEIRHDVAVIAAKSSSARKLAELDARSIGTRLQATYLIDGSVQSIGPQVRITAQLIDAASGKPVWSHQFDRPTRDLLAVQDEIALMVAQALELRVDTAAAAPERDRGTQSFDAWLQRERARKLLIDGRVADLPAAQQYLERAIRLDAEYSQAYVELAAVLLRQAEFAPVRNRREAFERAKSSAAELVDRAMAIDPKNGQAHMQRAYLLAFTDLDAAEREYRNGLALSPNDAAGYEGLAAVLYQNPQRYDEALAALDQARRLDPVEPRYDITKSGLLFYGRGDLAAATRLVQKVLDENPDYAPALSRMAGLAAADGRLAQAIHLAELALQTDPSSEWTRRMLASTYLDLGETAAANAVVAEAEADGAIPVRHLARLLESRQWIKAGDVAYEAQESETALAYDEPEITLALRRHARVTGEIRSALAAMETMADLNWDTNNEPTFPDTTDLRMSVLGVADMLLLLREEKRAHLVLQRLLAQIDQATKDHLRSGYWSRIARAAALAMLGDADSAMQSLQSTLADRLLLEKHRRRLELDPAFDSLRGRPDFRELQAQITRQIGLQRQELKELRQAGSVPPR
jgi:TolB-like protein/DNA-binding winged helix-turn-helix (wHTH) protein/Tfp pilus assembly protein PilF